MFADRRPEMLLSVLTLAALSAGGVVPLAAQAPEPGRDSVHAILQERMTRGGAIGLVAGVARTGEPILVEIGRYGTKDLTPVNAEAIFEIGSVAKALTGILLAEMVLRGEVALDDPIKQYLPDSLKVPSRNGRDITLLDLATHTSGLPRLPDNISPADPRDPYVDYGVGELYAFLSAYTLTRDPGSTYEYSNLGAGLLGHVLALRAGQPYEDAVIDRVLKPLGMVDTRIRLTPAQRERQVTGHTTDLEPASAWGAGVLEGAYAWRSTARDMLLLLRALLEPGAEPLGRALALATEPRRPAGAPGLDIGLGWHILRQGDRSLIWHNGQTGGFHAFLGVDRDAGTGALVLANAANDVDDIGRHLVNPAWPVRHPAPPRPTVTVATEILERYVGVYALAPQVSMTITRDGETLHAQVTGQQPFRMYAHSPTRFFFRAVEAEIEFAVDAAGQVSGLTLFQGGRELVAPRRQ